MKAPYYAALVRVSWLRRTVRYEWYDDDAGVICGPVFHATLMEWERARD